MKPQSCKSKGRRFQQKVARAILQAFTHLQDGDVVSTSMGAPGEDVRLSPAARTVLPLSIECKCVEKINIWACLEQTLANTRADTAPCLLFTRNRAPEYAVVPWETLLALYRDRAHAQGHGDGGDGGDRAAALPPRLVALLREVNTFVPAPPEEEGDAEA